MYELENCPLCNGKASFREKSRGMLGVRKSFCIHLTIECTGCGLSTREYIHEFSCKNGDFVVGFDGFKEAANDWNHRAGQKEVEVQGECEIYKTLPCKIGDTVFVYANNRAEETKVKAFKVYEDQILVYTTIGEFDAKHVYKDITELYANECRETSFG